MTQHERLERHLAAALDASAPSTVPSGLLARVEARVDQHRHRPRWLALVREPTMRLGSAVVVGSVSVRVAALVAATILLLAGVVGAGFAGSRLLGIGDGRTLVVDQTGNGTTTTIAAALTLAGEDDTILVRPGTYVEALVVDKNVRIMGDGAAGAVVLRAPVDGPTTTLAANRGDPYGILVRQASPTISGLTLRGQPSSIHVDGGGPVLEALILEGVGRPHTHSRGLRTFPDAIVIAGEARATVLRNTLLHGGAITVYDPATATIAGNTLVAGPSILSFTNTSGTVIDDNVVSGSLDRGIGVFSFGSPRVTVSRNRVEDPAADGISVGRGDSEGTAPVLRRNTISGALTGINVGPNAAPSIEDNTVTGSVTGLRVEDGADGVVVLRNRFIDNEIGVTRASAAGRFEGNHLCGNGTDVLSATQDAGLPTAGEPCE